jgi:hypothetical protein
VRRDGKMLRFDGKLVKRLFWFGILMTCAILDYFLEQWGIWGGVRFLLGVGAVLAFYLSLGRGVAFNMKSSCFLPLSRGS